MDTLQILKLIAMEQESDYLKKCISRVERYLESYKKNPRCMINDNYVAIYNDDILLLKISTEYINNK